MKIDDELIKSVTDKANEEIRKTVLYGLIEEWQTQYVLEALEKVKESKKAR